MKIKCLGEKEWILNVLSFNYFFSRLKSGLAPLVNDASVRRLELSKMEKKLDEKTGELGQLLQKIDASSKLLK